MMIKEILGSEWGIVASLASCHVLYAFIWFFPSTWMRMFKKKSVQVFETIAWLLKVLQFSAAVCWFMLRKPSGLDLFAVSPFQAIASLALGVTGQSLNAGIFNAIGHAGVYYGFKLGHQIPWVNGFPFNVVSHPQYVGAVLSIWAGVALVWSQAPQGLAFLALYWTGLYVVTGWMESSLH